MTTTSGFHPPRKGKGNGGSIHNAFQGSDLKVVHITVIHSIGKNLAASPHLIISQPANMALLHCRVLSYNTTVDWMFVFPKIHVEALILTVILFGGRAFGRYLGHDGGALMSEISTLMRNRRDDLFLCHVRTEQKVTICKPGNGHSVRIWQCWHPDLGLPASRTVRNKRSLFKPPSLWYSVIAAWTDFKNTLALKEGEIILVEN